MRALLIKASLLAAGIGYLVCAAGIEGTAPMVPCTLGMLGCLAWMAIVAYANR